MSDIIPLLFIRHLRNFIKNTYSANRAVSSIFTLSTFSIVYHAIPENLCSILSAKAFPQLYRVYSFFIIPYSVLKLFTGLANAALIAWKLTVANAIITASKPATANTHQLILVRYS